jgi:formamidopyrimidine-DNA glycosylase
MPELPDVENFRRGLRRRVLHRRIAHVHVGDDRALDRVSPRTLARSAEDTELAGTRRHGKHLFVELHRGDHDEDARWLHFHFGMTGAFAYFADTADDPEHDRVRFDLDDGGHLAFVDPRLFGRVGVVDSPEDYIRSAHLGPDALSSTFDPSALRRALAGKHTVKAALMDQSTVAGIGNVYADEILFQARIDPRRNPTDLTERDVSRLHRSIRRVLERAIARGAGTEALRDRLPRTWLLPHRSSGTPCPRCGGPIRAYEAAGRRGYWCPRCQT